MCKNILALFHFLFVWGTDFGNAQPQDLSFTHLSLPDGLSSYVVTALYRDSADILWVGNTNSIDRYNGIDFFPYLGANTDNKAKDFEVRFIGGDPGAETGFWIGTKHGGASRYDPAYRNFISIGFGEYDTSVNRITSLLVAGGKVWASLQHVGLFLYNEEADQFQLVYESDALIQDLIVPTVSPGLVWMGTDEGLDCFDTSALQLATGSNHCFFARQTLKNTPVFTLADGGEDIWLASGEILYRYAVSQLETIRVAGFDAKAPISAIEPSAVFPERIWLGTRGNGLWQYDSQQKVVHQYSYDADNAESLSSPDLLSVHEDTEGILWVGTINGLNKTLLLPDKFTSFRVDPAEELPSHPPGVMAAYEAPSYSGSVLLGMVRGPLYRFQRQSKNYELVLGRQDTLDYIIRLHEDYKGRIWFTGRYNKIFKLRPEGVSYDAFDVAEHRESLVIQHIHERLSKPGELWLSTNMDGLVVFDTDSGKVINRYSADPGAEVSLSSSDIWSVYESPAEPDILWIATRFGGINRFDVSAHSITAYRPVGNQRCPPRDVITIASNRPDTLWLGTYNLGLVRFLPKTGHCVPYTTDNGLPGNKVAGIYFDNRNRIWAITDAGIGVLDLAEEKIVAYTAEDGLQGDIFYFQAHYRNDRGEIVAGGENGFNIFHPDSISFSDRAPGVKIFEVQTDDSLYSARYVSDQLTAKPLVLAHDKNDIEFSVYASALKDPGRNYFRFMLEGADEAFGPVQKESSIRYRYLAPGEYNFKVIGANSEGAWNEVGDAFPFTIRPPYYQTWWFWLLTTSFFIGLIVSAYQYRIHQLKRVEQTRRDIAHDLHDDMGSRLSSLALQIEMAGLKLDPSDETRVRLNELAEVERGLVKDLRTIVWLINAEFDTLPRLAERMEQTAIQMLQGRRYTFEKPEGIPPFQLDMTTRKNIFLLYKEALHNAIRHSGAAYVNVELQLDELNTLTLLVEDDGKGFDVATALKGQGFHSMQARADALNGKIRFDSAPGKGTRILLSLPLVKKVSRFGVSTGWQWIRSKVTLS